MAANEKERNEIVFEIKRHIGTITAYPTGWKKELNLVAWNENNPKYDLRDWDPDHKHMSRGVTLHKDEARVLADMLAKEKF